MLDGLVQNADVQPTVTIDSWAAAANGTQTIKYSLTSLTGADAGNYTLAASQQQTMTITIAETNIRTLGNLVVKSNEQTLVPEQTNKITVASGKTAETAVNDFVNNISVAAGSPLVKGTDYDVTNAAGVITISGVGNYTGSLTYPYEVVYEFGEDDVTPSGTISDFTYNGAAQVPEWKVTDPATDKETTAFSVAYQQSADGTTYTPMTAGTLPTNVGY